jgi:hypothetical protein
MTDPLKAFMQANALSTPAFAPDSRYHGLDIAQWRRPDGTTVSFVRRRFIPPPERFATLQEHRVAQGDRLDNLAARYLGDPQQYWRICDGNGALRPAELTATVGRRLRITLPEGLPGEHGE